MGSGSHDTKQAASSPAIGIDEVLERFGGDFDLLVEVAGVFLEDYPSTLERIRAAVAASDADGLHRAAHALKGSVANFAAAEARDAALALETMGREGALEEAREGLARLEAALDRLATELRDLGRDRG